MADALENGVEIAGAVEADGALAEFAAGDDFAFQSFVERNALAGAHLAARADQRLPVAAVRGDRAKQEDLDAATEELAALRIVLADREGVDARAMAEEPRREDARIVEHQAIAGAQEFRKIAESCGPPTGPRRDGPPASARRHGRLAPPARSARPAGGNRIRKGSLRVTVARVSLRGRVRAALLRPRARGGIRSCRRPVRSDRGCGPHAR